MPILWFSVMPAPKHKQIDAVVTMIATLVNSDFWGELVIKFESGNVVHIKKSESIKINKAGGVRNVTTTRGSGRLPTI